MTKSLPGMRTALLGTAALAFALLNAGCGGTSTAKSSATPASPYALGIDDGTGAEASGFGLPLTVSNPSAAFQPATATTPAVPGDVAYYTSATAITPLGSSPPIFPGAAGAGLTAPLGGAMPAGQAGVTFRADISNGVTAGGGIPTITSVTLTSTDPQWTLGTLPLTFAYTLTTAAGPYVDATYTTAAFTSPFTTQGVHTVSVTVTDSAGDSTRTDYNVEVVAAPDIFVTINNVDTGTKDSMGNEIFAALAAGDTATLTPAAGTPQTLTADSSGTTAFFVTPGMYTLTVNTNTTATPPVPITYTQALDLTNTPPGGSFAQVKKRAATKLRAAVKLHH